MAITEVTLKVAAAAHNAVSLQLQFGAEDADVRMRHLAHRVVPRLLPTALSWLPTHTPQHPT